MQQRNPLPPPFPPRYIQKNQPYHIVEEGLTLPKRMQLRIIRGDGVLVLHSNYNVATTYDHSYLS